MLKIPPQRTEIGFSSFFRPFNLQSYLFAPINSYSGLVSESDSPNLVPGFIGAKSEHLAMVKIRTEDELQIFHLVPLKSSLGAERFFIFHLEQRREIDREQFGCEPLKSSCLRP